MSRTSSVTRLLLPALLAGSLIACTPGAPQPAPTSAPIPTSSAPPTGSAPPSAPAETFPTSAAQYYTPSFDTLKWGTVEDLQKDEASYEPVIWFGAEGPEVVAATLALNLAAVPANQCGLIAVSDDPAVVQASAEQYANCLIDSWRPLTKSVGVEMPRVKVVHCAVTRKSSTAPNQVRTITTQVWRTAPPSTWTPPLPRTPAL